MIRAGIDHLSINLHTYNREQFASYKIPIDIVIDSLPNYTIEMVYNRLFRVVFKVYAEQSIVDHHDCRIGKRIDDCIETHFVLWRLFAIVA